MPNPFSSRPDQTFLVQAGSHGFRVDLRLHKDKYEVLRVLRGAKGSGKDSDPFNDFSDPLFGGEPVDAAGLASLLKLKPKPANEVTVLSDRTTTVITDLTSDDSDWQGSAAMEAQTISGLSPSECVSVSTRLPAEQGMIRAWTVQASMNDLAGLRTALTREDRGCRLVAVGHPAGIRVDPHAPQLEHWFNLSFFHASDNERLNLRAWNGSEAHADAGNDPEVAASLLGREPEANVILGASEEGNPSFSNCLDFSQDEALNVWARALAQAIDPLSGRVLGMPKIAVPKPPPSTAALAMTSAGVSFLILALLGGHYLFNKSTQHHLEEELTRLQRPGEKLAAERKQITSLRRELKRLEDEVRASHQNDELDVFAHRKRMSALLAGIAAGASLEEAAVLEISPIQDFQTVISGAATTFNAPQDLARTIDETLAPEGLRASLFRRTAKLIRDDGGPWTYEIRLTPSLPLEEDAPDAGQTAQEPSSAPQSDSSSIHSSPRSRASSTLHLTRNP